MDDPPPDDLRRAEAALHLRAELACAAATSASLPGRFDARRRGGLFTVHVSEPSLRFLCAVWGADPGDLGPALRALDDLPLARLVLPRPGVDGAARCRSAGLHRLPDSVLALASPASPSAGPSAGSVRVRVEDAEPAAFAAVLLDGYLAGGVLADFLRTEHLAWPVHRFLARSGGQLLGAAAMTLHGDVAVLGGAATPVRHRGRGAQSALLRHRLGVAAGFGCTLAVATAAVGSPSERNLARHGFATHRRTNWVRPATVLTR
ncbi:hypothetical protein CFN78_16685 [Amycolatopsis antarctica]|uniref:N-acetyltransferase domain-containing protein n=1 Tax=Amycolatopsis antarctica TaxID=1854586 RepID=A0A263D476_9PSEU|nr:GNAT family N-acetyltransferase [Amycolatopsis antarctica]OZM72165.1 hypothetical protein CFN78_16685 [Amycolatopsis antarctica]